MSNMTAEHTLLGGVVSIPNCNTPIDILIALPTHLIIVVLPVRFQWYIFKSSVRNFKEKGLHLLSKLTIFFEENLFAYCYRITLNT